jgi:glutamate racemase
MKQTSPIVVLDSGLGGLTVAAALRRIMPHDDIIYFGDTARVPYGSKTATTVTLCVRQIIRYLLPFDPKHVVIACNTATALALPAIRQEFTGLPISGVIEPGARAAIDAAGKLAIPTIGVIATEATIRSKAYERAIVRRRQHARLVLRATPLLVPIIEEGRAPEDPLVRLALAQYLTPMAQRGINVLLLGCTHYPILRQAIVEMVGPGVAVIDSAAHCAEDVAGRLAQRRLLRSETDAAARSSPTGTLRCFVTDDSPRFATLAARFLGTPIDPPTWVSLDELSAATQAVTSLRAG